MGFFPLPHSSACLKWSRRDDPGPLGPPGGAEDSCPGSIQFPSTEPFFKLHPSIPGTLCRAHV